MGKRWLNKAVIILLLCLVIIDARGGDALRLQLTFNWDATKWIYLPDSSLREVLDVDEAIYSEFYQYLPLVKHEVPGYKIDSIRVIQMQLDSMSDEERAAAQAFVHAGLSTVSIKNYTAAGSYASEIHVIPLHLTENASSPKKIQSLTLDLYLTQRAHRMTSERRQQEPYNSVLSSGEWYKLAVTAEGIHKIDRDLLKKIGINADNVDPRKIRIFGNGGKMLPQPNSQFRYDDLVENAIYVSGESDGSFDREDYILFYATDPHTHHYNPANGDIVFENNSYSDSTCYFLNVGTDDGLRVPSVSSGSGQHQIIDTFNDFIWHELDQINLIFTGREWYGEKFDLTRNYRFDFDIPGILDNSNIEIISSVMAQTYESATMDLTLNGSAVGTQVFQTVTQGSYTQKALDHLDIFSMPAAAVAGDDNNYTLRYSFNKAASGISKAYLNYFILSYERQLRLYGSQTSFQSLNSLNYDSCSFELTYQGNQPFIWDVTLPVDPKNIAYSVNGNKAIFNAKTDTLRKFVAFTADDLPEPLIIGQMDNQNLHGQPAPDLLIITHPGFLPEAQRLADLRSQHNGLDVLVATTEQVFNEFSSGSQDVTALRDICKFYYDQHPGEPKLKNLLLFGRGSLDYKDYTRQNTNFVPIYMSRNSLHPLKSYASNYYYGCLDGDEGQWEESFDGDHMMDIGVGRLPVKSLEEARIVVDKLIHYETNSATLGKWRNDVYFVADDGDINIHQRDADQLSVLVDTTYRQFNVNKIFVDAFEQVSAPSGEVAPGAKEALEQAIKDGALIVNFTGHGSETQWTSETIFNISSINQLENYNQLPLFVTATCEFGRHDDPRILSGAEYLLINADGGAIGLVTTSRPVFSSTNYLLNRAFYDYVFSKDQNGYQDLGTIFMRTKNGSLNGSINRNFSLLGDPSMKLSYPKEKIRLMVDENYQSPGDTLKALEKISMRGEISDQLNQKIETFNGIVYITVFDKEQLYETLGNENPPMTYRLRSNVLYRGQASVENGDFDFEFVVPKNIDYRFDEGKIHMYAISNDDRTDANGAEVELIVGGSTASAPEDNQPPEIQLYLNDTTFRNGGITDENALLLGFLSDENGINITDSGIGQGIIAYLDDNQVFNLNKYYMTSLDTFSEGWVTFPLQNLSKGDHHIRLKVWDTHNNSSEASIEFTVTDGSRITIDRLINYPNPFRDHTSIAFEHNRAGDDLVIKAELYSITGAKVKEVELLRENAESHMEIFELDARDSNGKVLDSGIYVLRIFLRSTVDGTSVHRSRKLVIVN